MTLIAIILYRYFMMARKKDIYEWYQVHRPRWLPDCAWCVAYNLSFIEWVLWMLFMFEIGVIKI